MKYTSQKSHFATYTDGAQGIAYTLSLNNDYDTVVFDQQNNLISTLPITITATRMANGDLSSIGEFEDVVITPANGWSDKATFDKNTGRLEITYIPDGFTEATFEISWKIKAGVVLSKVFSLKKQISAVDYELIVDRSVINSTNMGGKIKVTINEKDINGITAIGPNNKGGLTLIGATFEEDTNNNCWYIAYSKGDTESITITLTENDFIWDTEAIEFVSDGNDGIDGTDGKDGASLMVKYINSATKPTITNNNVTGWSDTIPTVEIGKHTYMTQKMSNAADWSEPVQISAEDGVTPTIKINNGYWEINGEITDVKAEGEDGKNGNTPTITVGSNGNWYIDGADSGQKAQGEAGKDGSNIEYVYYRSENKQENLQAPSYTGTTLTEGWTASPQGITEVYKYEYMSVRTKPAGTNTNWSSFSTPVIWSKWGEKGQDGDGVSYEYYLSNSATAPSYNASDSKWTDEPTGVSENNQYEYVVQIKIVTNDDGTKTSTPSNVALWAKWGENGREEIKRDRYYYITDTNTTPPLYENFKDNSLWGVYHPDNIQISSNGLQITVDDKINNIVVFATKAERWPESRLVSFEGWITSENNDDNKDVEEFIMQCDLIPRNSSTSSEDGFPQFSPVLTKEKRRYSYLMELGAEAVTNDNKEVTLRLFSDVPQGDSNDMVPNDVYIENLLIWPLSNNTTWTKNTHATLEQGQYLWSFDIVEYSKADEFGNKYSVTPIEQQAYLATDGTSPYLISFDNDSATIGAEKDGSVNETTLANVSKVTVKVYLGKDEITDGCNFNWSVTGEGTLNSYNDKEIWFTKLNTNTATATVSVTLKESNTPIGTKTFTISKSIAGQTGDAAVTYKLSVSPNSINLTTNPDGVTPSFIVTKYTGSAVENISSGYTIEREDGLAIDTSIKSKATFLLKVDGKTVDTETVDVVNDGKPGKGIKSVVNYYLATTSGSGVITSTSGWGTTVPSNFNSTNKYLWNYEETLDTDGNVISTTDPTIIGTWGQDGTDGKGITSIEEYYATTITPTSQPADGDWKKVPDNPMPTIDSTNKYLWNYEIIKYTDNSTTETTPAIIGAYGDTGVGIRGTKTESIRVYLISNSATADKPTVTADGETLQGGWSETEPNGLSDTNKYIWSCTGTKTTTYSSATDTTGETKYNNDWTTPELYKAYTTNTNIDPLNYATFLRLSNFEEDQGNFYSSDGRMYINAEFMNVGSLLVNNAFSVAINGGKKNLAKGSTTPFIPAQGSENSTDINTKTYCIDPGTNSWQVNCQAAGGLKIDSSVFKFSTDITSAKYYTLRFKVKKISGTFNYIGGHAQFVLESDDIRQCRTYINGIKQSEDYSNGIPIEQKSNQEIEVVFIFLYGRPEPQFTDGNIYIQPNRLNYDIDGDDNADLPGVYQFTNVTIYEGEIEPSGFGSIENIVTGINADSNGVSIQGNKIDFTTSEFVIQDTADNTLFAAYGKDYAGSNGTKGTVQIAGWAVNEKMLSKVPKGGELGDYDSLFLTTEDLEKVVYIGGVGQKGWRLGIGNWFGVSSIGQLHARAAQLTEANITGTLTTGITGTYTRIQDGEVQNASLNWSSMSATGVGYSIAKFTSGYLEISRTNTEITSAGDGTATATLGWYLEGENYTNGAYTCPFMVYAPNLILGDTSSEGQLWGTWKLHSGTPVTSWRGAKYDIEDLSDKYSVMFDNLRPVRHKYIDGTSGRYHTGFILDELKTAMDIADVGTNELAAYCVYNKETGEGGIRYSELVALNTYEIQKLKSRVSTLEQTILNYESRISALETEIQNLKSV